MARLKSTLIRQIGIFQFIQFIYKESSDSLKAGFMSASVSVSGSNFFLPHIWLGLHPPVENQESCWSPSSPTPTASVQVILWFLKALR